MSFLKVGIKGCKTLKTVHRYDFLFPSYGQLKTGQCPPPEAGTMVLHTFFVKLMSLVCFFPAFSYLSWYSGKKDLLMSLKIVWF